MRNRRIGAAVVAGAGLIALAMASGSCTTSGGKATNTNTNTPTAVPTNTPAPTNTFTAAGTSTPTFLPTPTLAGYMYIFGGDNNSGNISASYSAQIMAGGALGTWTSTNALPVAVTNLCYTFGGGYAFAIGGATTGTVSTVYYAAMSGGTLGPWAAASPMPGGVNVGGAGIAQGQLWVWGAAAGGVYASTLSGGLPTTWTTAAFPMATPVGAACWGTNGTYLFSAGGDIGGGASTSVMQICGVSPGGVNTPWTTLGPALPSTQSYQGFSLEAGVLISAGGSTTGWGANPSSSVYTVTASGAVPGAWVSQAALPSAFYQPAVVRTGGYVYVVGGWVSASIGNTVYRGAITGATIPSWTTLANLPMNFEAHGIAVY